MSKAKPTHMRPILEDVVDAGVISPELRKAIKWSLVTIDDLTQRLAAAEAALNLSTDERQTAEVRCEELTERLAAAEAALAKIALDHEGPAAIAWDALGNPRTRDLWKMIEAAKGGQDE